MAYNLLRTTMRRAGSLATRLAAPVAPHVSATATCRWARPAAVSGLHIARAAAARGFASMTGAPAAPHASESFLSGTNSVYVEEMYRLWKQDPSSVHASWNTYFKNVDSGLLPGQAFLAPPDLQPGVQPTGGVSDAHGADIARIVHLIRAFQVRGHEVANLDPLALTPRKELAELDYKNYGFDESDLDREFNFAGLAMLRGFYGDTSTTTLRAIIEKLERAYCHNIGFEYMHINDREMCNWIRERVEAPETEWSKEERLQMLDRMTFAETFEKFLGLKYGSHKRFGLDGCESLIPGMKTMIDRVTQLGTEYIVIGMPHRGRLNVLCNVIRKPAEEVFNGFDDVHKELEGTSESADWAGSGDVKYHLGTSHDRSYKDGRKVHLTLVANPSHLEAVNPVVVGKVRAQQDLMKDTEGDKVLGVLMHGDAAFSGQGVVYETMHLAKLRKYTTRGTVHIVVNNQIGFTTNPRDSRSSDHPSDVGKAFDVPIFHVNADDVEAVCRVFKLAAEWRQHFNADCIIDLVGYRRFGHNEGDQPMFTQPAMYSRIKQQPSTLTLYRRFLLENGHVTSDEADRVQAFVDQCLHEAFDQRNAHVPAPRWLGSSWTGFKDPKHLSAIRTTGVSEESLRTLGKKLTTVPEGFTLHSNLKRQIDAKAKAIESGTGIDWGTAEALAFASVLMEGDTVRISGQDVQRGTFSHRHAKWHDQKDFTKRYMPLANLDPEQGSVYVCNSSLSEFGVLGFELGYSQHNPHQLVIWEAQFGDFANGAQVIIDQFLSCSEQKWYRQCGLVMLLPHGHDGGGPEHSSARLERYLQMSDEPEDSVPDMDEDRRQQIQATNWQVVNVTTPANYFHVLRRQVVRDFRKPLVVMSPKSLLRLPACVSDLADMAEGTKFKRYIPDEAVTSKAKRVILCTGKVYYELVAKREELGLDNVAIGRVEQICPFPFDLVAEELKAHPDADVLWVQEEPRNQGAWTYIRPRVETAVQHYLGDSSFRVKYGGRPVSAATAVGSAAAHKADQARLLREAFTLE